MDASTATRPGVAHPRTELVLASGWANAERRKVMAAKACHDFDALALQELVRTYVLLESKKGARVSAATLRAYASGVRLFLAFCRPDLDASPDVVLHRCTRDDLKRYVYGRQLAVAPESVRLNLAAVRVLFKALVWAGVIDRSPAEDVSSLADPRPRHERRGAVATDDFQTLLDVVSTGDTTGQVKARDTAILRLLGDQALRNSELCALEVADLNMRRKTLHIRSGKGGKSATLPLTRATHQALAEWLEQHPTGRGALFVNLSTRTRRAFLHAPMSPESLRGILAKIYEAAGLENQGAHALRHTSAVRLYKKTRDLHMVARHLRHSDISTSAIYAKMADDDLRDALDGLD